MLAVFKKSIVKVRKDTLLSMFFIAVESAFEIIIPLIMARLIDSGIEKNDMNAISRFGFIILILVMGQATSGGLCAFFSVRAGSVFAGDIRERLFRKLQTFAFSNIDKFSTGSLVTRSTTDIANVQRSFQMVIRGAIRSISMCFFSLYFAYRVNAEIARCLTFLIPVIIISFVFL